MVTTRRFPWRVLPDIIFWFSLSSIILLMLSWSIKPEKLDHWYYTIGPWVGLVIFMPAFTGLLIASVRILYKSLTSKVWDPEKNAQDVAVPLLIAMTIVGFVVVGLIYFLATGQRILD